MNKLIKNTISNIVLHPLALHRSREQRNVLDFDPIQSSVILPIDYSKLWEKICMPLTQRTAQILDTKQKKLQEIVWTDSEANMDSGFSKLGCMCCVKAFDDIKKEYPEYNNLSLKCRIPDINILFYKNSEGSESDVGSTSECTSNIIATGKIELKSGKGKGLIPGSTIGSLNINEPVIFCLRNESNYTFRYNQYYNCIGESNTDMFQDRTPRPHVNFQKMTDINTPIKYIHKEKSDWVEHYANCAFVRIKSNKPYKSWQDYLTEKIKKLSIKEFIKETSIEEFAKLKSELY